MLRFETVSLLGKTDFVTKRDLLGSKKNHQAGDSQVTCLKHSGRDREFVCDGQGASPEAE